MAYSIRSIVKGSAIYALGQGLTKASTFLLIPVYISYLTPNDYGIVGYLQVVLQILATIMMFGFYGAQTRFFYEYKEDYIKVGKFLFSINVWLLLSLIPFATLMCFYGESIYLLIGAKDIPFYPYLPVIIWASVFQVFNQMVITYWIARKKYYKTTMLQLIQFAFITICTVVLIVGMRIGAIGYFYGILYGQLMFFLFFYPSYSKLFIGPIYFPYIFYSLSFGFPIVLHLLSSTLHTMIDRAILVRMVSMREIGLYTLGYQVGMAMYLITSSINSAWIPNYYELMSSSWERIETHIHRTYNLWISIISVIAAIGILWGGDILKVISSEQYYGGEKVVPFIFLGYFFHGIYLFMAAPIYYYKRTNLLFLFTGSSALINIILNLLFIPVIGIVGAALATTISMFFQAMMVYLFSRRFKGHNIKMYSAGLAAILIEIALLGQWYGAEKGWAHIFRIGYLITIIAYSSFICRNDLKKILEGIKI